VIRRLILALVSLGVLACGAEEDAGADGESSAGDAGAQAAFDPVARNCPAGAVAIDECTRGVGWVDCGGTGDPLMACDDQGCAWFGGGCVASGWEPSFCPAGDPFCETTADGAWPFATDWFPANAYFNDPVCHGMDMIGDAPISATSALDLSVTLAAADSAPDELGVDCEGSGLWMCRSTSQVSVTSTATTLTFDRAPGTPLLTERVIVEVLPRDDGTLGARAFVYYADDVSTADRACGRWGDRPAFVDGEVIVDDLGAAEAPHGSVHLEEADGGAVTFTF